MWSCPYSGTDGLFLYLPQALYLKLDLHLLIMSKLWVQSCRGHSLEVDLSMHVGPFQVRAFCDRCNNTLYLRDLSNMSVTSSARFPSFLSLLPPCITLYFLNWSFLSLFWILFWDHLVLLSGWGLCNVQQPQISKCLLSPGTTLVGLLIKIWQVEPGIHFQNIAAIKLRSITYLLIQQTANDQKSSPLVFWVIL